MQGQRFSGKYSDSLIFKAANTAAFAAIAFGIVDAIKPHSMAGGRCFSFAPVCSTECSNLSLCDPRQGGLSCREVGLLTASFVCVHVRRGAGISKTLEKIGQIPAVGFVNALAIAGSGRFVLAGLGQEPRLGRWGKAKIARCGVLVQPLNVSDS